MLYCYHESIQPISMKQLREEDETVQVPLHRVVELRPCLTALVIGAILLRVYIILLV